MQSAVKVAASRQFSAAVTGSGEVWTFGMGLHFELGTSEVIQGSPRPVQGKLATLIAVCFARTLLLILRFLHCSPVAVGW